MFRVVSDEKDFLIIEKYSGIEFHGELGLLALLRESHPVLFGVHRLDKETSGIMVFAKSKEAQIKLSKQFEMRQTHKFYFAISKSKPSKKMGNVIGDLAKSRGGSYKLERSKQNPSRTKFISAYSAEEDLRLFCLKPLTGQTHQLRVVLKSLGSPVAGDSRYKGIDGVDRMYLHAYQLAFTYEEQFYEFKVYPAQGELFHNDNIRGIFETQLSPDRHKW